MNVFSPSVTCCRMFKYEILLDQEAHYRQYLETIVNRIDAMAEVENVFYGVATLQMTDHQQKRYHCRIFSFTSQVQRDAFADAMLIHANRFDGSTEATQRRKAYAETLRRLVSVEDFDVI